jgi:hypothetical protein
MSRARAARERPGAKGVTGRERDYDEVLSRVLPSTTDRIEPVKAWPRSTNGSPGQQAG